MKYAFVSLSAILTAAHFLRNGPPGAAAACLGVIALPLIKRRWVIPVIQALLAVFFLLSVDTLVTLVNVRRTMGAPWLRLTVIMGAVCLVHAGGVAWFFRKAVRNRYAFGNASGRPSAAAFFITASFLAAVELEAPGMLLLSRFVPGGGWFEGLLLALYAAFVTEKMLHPQDQPVWRLRIWTLFAVVFFAQLALGVFGADRMLMTGTLPSRRPPGSDSALAVWSL